MTGRREKSKEAKVPIRFPIWLPIKQSRIYMRYMGNSGVALHKKLQSGHTGLTLEELRLFCALHTGITGCEIFRFESKRNVQKICRRHNPQLQY